MRCTNRNKLLDRKINKLTSKPLPMAHWAAKYAALSGFKSSSSSSSSLTGKAIRDELEYARQLDSVDRENSVCCCFCRTRLFASRCKCQSLHSVETVLQSTIAITARKGHL